MQSCKRPLTSPHQPEICILKQHSSLKCCINQHVLNASQVSYISQYELRSCQLEFIRSSCSLNDWCSLVLLKCCWCLDSLGLLRCTSSPTYLSTARNWTLFRSFKTSIILGKFFVLWWSVVLAAAESLFLAARRCLISSSAELPASTADGAPEGSGGGEGITKWLWETDNGVEVMAGSG